MPPNMANYPEFLFVTPSHVDAEDVLGIPVHITLRWPHAPPHSGESRNPSESVSVYSERQIVVQLASPRLQDMTGFLQDR